MSQKRLQAGTPDGGQFAPMRREERSVVWGGPPDVQAVAQTVREGLRDAQRTGHIPREATVVVKVARGGELEVHILGLPDESMWEPNPEVGDWKTRLPTKEHTFIVGVVSEELRRHPQFMYSKVFVESDYDRVVGRYQQLLNRIQRKVDRGELVTQEEYDSCSDARRAVDEAAESKLGVKPGIYHPQEGTS